MKKAQKLAKGQKNLSSAARSETFTDDEMKRLLKIARSGAPQVELIAFMHESPHLMRNPDVRNFFDALFFNQSFLSIAEDKEFLKTLPDQIDQEIKRLETMIKTSLKEESIQDTETLQSRFDTILYYYEMKEKVENLYYPLNYPVTAFTSSKKELADLRQICETREELQGSLAYAARVHLKCLLAHQEKTDLPEILKNYILISAYPTDERNMDPSFNEEIKRHWQTIEQTLTKNYETTPQYLNAFLDQLCYAKDLPLDSSQWKQVKEATYQNATFEVNLKTLEVSQLEVKGNFVVLPSHITQHPSFQSIFGEGKKDLRAQVQEIGTKKIYSLQDVSGHPIQIEVDKGLLSFYKRFPQDKGKWLQLLPDNVFSLENTKELAQDLLENTSLIGLLKTFFNSKNDKKIQSAFSIFASYTLYADPNQPSTLFCLDSKGTIAFQLKVQENKEGLKLENVIDYRSSPINSWEVYNASQSSNEAIVRLSSFENKENMIFWSQKGTLKKVELPRYGLTFKYEKGQLVCHDEPFKDYQIDLNATLQEKKGFFHALILQHSDSTKPKKLVVPEAEAIIYKEEPVFPKARGFAKIALFFEKLKNLYRTTKGKTFQVDQGLNYELDRKKNKLSFISFDIRPYTGEICQQQTHWEMNLLELIKQALKTNQQTLAGELLSKLHLSPKILNQKILNHLINFIEKPISDLGASGVEAALKIKLCLSLKQGLKQQRMLTKPIREKLNQHLKMLGKQVFEQGRKIPQNLQLTQAERLQLVRLFKKQDSAYYEQQLKVYFIEQGLSFDLSAPITGKDQFDVHLAAWKQERSAIKVEDRIQALENQLTPSVRLQDADLAYAVPLAIEKTSLLSFDEADERLLFDLNSQKLPSITLTPLKDQTRCEKQALKEYQTALDEFKAAEDKRPHHVLKATKKELKEFLETKLISQKTTYENVINVQQNQIEKSLRQVETKGEQLAIYAGQQSIASFDELRQALVHDQLEELQKKGRLPSTLNLVHLKANLIDYFDALSHKNAAEAAIGLIEEILIRGKPENTDEWQSLSEALHRLLTIKRHYDPQQDPRLLVFEAQQFINLRPLDGGLDQLDLLDALVKNPYAVIQAPTGAGKTAVLSVMRSLLKANGKNLVIQKVLPALYQQTYTKFQSVLGGLYGTSIYALRFNLKMRMSQTEIKMVQNEQGAWIEKKIQHSLFKGMYQDLLDTIKNKGCVLTDYKSLPLLEEMFFKVGLELTDHYNNQGTPLPPLLEEHHTYLRKILVLLENKADENMDEFDQPNRPIQKIQLDMGTGAHLLPSFLIDQSLTIYDLLIEDPELQLLKNIQSDLTDETRQKIIERNAKKMAARLAQEAGNLQLSGPLLDYLLGKNENALNVIENMPPAYKDQVALCKDQFSIYLPLTLKSKEGSRYARSEEGSRTLPCYNGEKHDAKFGTILEQINYTIQDYLQAGITLYDLKPYLTDLKTRFDESESYQDKELIKAQFSKMLPEFSIVKAFRMMQTTEGAAALIKHINQDHSKIKEFLIARLRQIKTSGALISMDPQNAVDMSRAISGISATMGAPDSLHRQFQVNAKLNGQIQANMIYRLQRRAEKEAVIQYDPANPELMLQSDIHAIIDGAGAFKDAHKAAQTLQSLNPDLEQVGYHKEDESIEWVGHPTGDIKKTGFFFSQSHTTGTDKPLIPTAKALLTLNGKDGISEFFQKEGRLRQERQRYQLAMPKYQGIQTVSQEITHAIAQESLVNALDIFRKCKQELNGILRNGMKQALLSAQTPLDFIALFQNEDWRNYFISTPEADFNALGSYFFAHQHIQFANQPPKEILTAYKATLIQKAQALGLSDVVNKLNQIEYSEELLAKMPEEVAPLGSTQGELEMEVQIEQEEESEQEQELQLETQQEQVKNPETPPVTYHSRLVHEKITNPSISYYALRRGLTPTTHTAPLHEIQAQIHPAYSSLLHVTEAFLPFSRVGQDSLYQRRPFDERMYRIGEVYFDIDFANNKINKVFIDDPLRDSSIRDKSTLRYDIRTNRLISIKKDPSISDLTISPKDIIHTKEFIALIAEIKFFDGRLSGYSPTELEALEVWLRANSPTDLKNHLLNDILRYRYQDKQAFVGSQLGQLFDRLSPL